MKAEIQRNGFDGKIPAGIVLTGGTSKMEGVVELAESIFQTSVRIGVPENFKGMESVLKTQYMLRVLVFWDMGLIN